MRFASVVLQVLAASSGVIIHSNYAEAKSSVTCISTKDGLKKAIVNASDNAVIPICGGTTLTFDKTNDSAAMTLSAEGVELICISSVDGTPAKTCVLDGGSLSGRKSGILDVQADSFAVSGITFQNAESSLPGAALHVTGNGSGAYILKDCTFLNNKVTGSGGAAVELQTCEGCTQGGTLMIADCMFAGNANTNTKLAYGGALSAANFEDALMERCTFTQNKSALETGAADFDMIKNVKISDCIFSENYATVYNGALDVALCGNVEIDRCSFHMNEAGHWAGAAHIEQTTNAIISSSTFTGNKDSCRNCEEGGSAVGADTVGNLFVKNSSFVGNTSMGWGTVCSTYVQTLQMENTSFRSNSAEGGAGIYADYGSSLVVKDSQFSMNTAVSDCGGGIETDSYKSVRYSNLCFQMNQAPDGGAGCSWDDQKSVQFENVMTNSCNIASGKGCKDFSFSGKCQTFPTGSCPIN